MKILCTDYPKAFIYTRMYPIPDTYIKQDNLERKKMYPTTLLTFPDYFSYYRENNCK